MQEGNELTRAVQAYMSGERVDEDRERLAPVEPWAEGAVDPRPVQGAGPTRVPDEVVRVALLRCAGIEDTVTLATALGLTASQVVALETDPGFVNTVRRLRLAAGLGSWRSHVEGVVATGMLPSGTPAMGATQAQFLKELWDREEPKVTDAGSSGFSIVLTGEAMERLQHGLREGARDVIDVTPRTAAPAMDPELEARMKAAKQEVTGA